MSLFLVHSSISVPSFPVRTNSDFALLASLQLQQRILQTQPFHSVLSCFLADVSQTLASSRATERLLLSRAARSSSEGTMEGGRREEGGGARGGWGQLAPEPSKLNRVLTFSTTREACCLHTVQRSESN